MDNYAKRGVSSQKEDVHSAIKNIDKGLFPTAFCKVTDDFLGLDNSYCNIMHADGAGTKSALAYLYYKETGDISVFKGIVMDAIVMNVDDLLCVGAFQNFLLSNTIGRNPYYITSEILTVIIQEFDKIANWFCDMGIPMVLTGGETADVGDIVRTLIVDSTITTRIKKNHIIANDKIKPGMVIVGLASFGKATYEKYYNSGIGSNGLTSARHDLLHKKYKKKYPETYNPDIPKKLVYCGKYKVTDKDPRLPIDIGKALLSPTRTYAPLLKEIITNLKDHIGGIVHCTGGGQTKCLKFGKNLHYIKDNLFKTPPIFQLIKESGKTSLKEMFKVYNMGHRMEIYTEKIIAEEIIDIAKRYEIDAQIIGEIKISENKNKLTIKTREETFEYE